MRIFSIKNKKFKIYDREDSVRNSRNLHDPHRLFQQMDLHRVIPETKTYLLQIFVQVFNRKADIRARYAEQLVGR